jgi:branched-chain amino acid transport system substrate-binding protein
MRARRSVSTTALIVAGALGLFGLAACGSSNAPSSSSGKSTTPSATTSAAPITTGGYHPVSNYMAFINGKAGKANPKLSPVYVGVVNQQGGTADIAPEWTYGADIAADFINDQAGGIDGHPVKIVSCFIPDTVSSAAQCGQQFANNSKISAVSVGAVAVGNEAMESALAPTGKVLVFGVSVSPVDTTYKNGYILFGDATHVEAPLATFIKEYLHSKSVSIVYPELPGSNVDAEITEAALKYEGIPVKVVGFDPTTTNLTAPLIASGAASAGLVINDSPAPTICSAIYKAIKQLNITTPVLANVPCDNPVTAQGDGGQLPVGWYYASANPLPGDAADPSLAAFKTLADTYGEKTWDADAWTADSFAQFLTIAKWDGQLLSEGKPITAANLNTIAKTFKGPVPQGAPHLVCGSFAAAPAVCNDEVSFFQNISPGVMKAIARWIGPPAGFVIPKNLE